MKVEEIERLLAEFYEGTTTESQEEVLRNYFRTTEVPGHLLKDKEIFLNLCPDADQELQKQLALDWRGCSYHIIAYRHWIRD